jgi:RNA polymerase sigma factor (sigma-70 family)
MHLLSGSTLSPRPRMLDQLNPEAILVEHLGYIEKFATTTCRQNGLHGADAEDFISWLKIRLIENDFAVIRKFRGESKITTYLSMVVTRQLYAYLREQHGRWRPSAAAEKLGPPADALEELVYRDGYSLPQAAEKLRTEGRTSLSDPELAHLLARLPERQPMRPKEVSLDRQPMSPGEESSAPVIEPEASARADDLVNEAETRERHGDFHERLARVMAQLTPEERFIVRLYFQEDHSVADVARALKVDQKPLYRRIPRIRERLRQLLEREGISSPDFLAREDA